MEALKMPNDEIYECVDMLATREHAWIRAEDISIDGQTFIYIKPEAPIERKMSEDFSMKIFRVEEGLICDYKEAPLSVKWHIDFSYCLEHDPGHYEGIPVVGRDIEEYEERLQEQYEKDESVLDQDNDLDDDPTNDSDSSDESDDDDELTNLEKELATALEREEYEKASRIRDEINKRKKEPNK
jgi:hypothetical protein